MRIPDGQIHAEPIPGFPMPIAQMMSETISKVPSQADVIKPIFPVQRIDSMASAYEVSNDILIPL